jgi:hypothetical protein
VIAEDLVRIVGIDLEPAVAHVLRQAQHARVVHARRDAEPFRVVGRHAGALRHLLR